VGRSPQPLRRVQRIDIEVLPLCAFVAALVMKHAMMKPAEPLDQIRLALKRVAAVSRYEGRFYSARKRLVQAAPLERVS